MKRPVVLGAVLASAIGVPLAAGGAPYEDQKIQIQRIQQAKLRGAGASSTQCTHMQQHMPLMQEMRQQMGQAGAIDQMATEQMRNWIKEHTALMERMHRQMQRE